MTAIRTVADYIAESDRLNGLLDDALAFGKRMVREYAEAEAAYREAKSYAWVQSDGDLLAKQREAWVDAATAQKRKARDIAEGMKQMALEAIRSRRAQISALQTLANVEKAEMELAR